MSPAASPTPLRDARRHRPQSARRPARLCRLRGHQVPARGWWEEPPPEGRGAGLGHPASARLSAANGELRDRRLLAVLGPGSDR